MKKLLPWLKIILPPLVLMFLHRFPMDLGTSLIFLAVFVIAIISAINIIKMLFASLAKKKFPAKEVIRPILAILIIFGNVSLIKASVRSVDDYAEKIANKIQIQCKLNNKCPKTISGFKQQQHRLVTKYGEYGSKYYVSYIISKDMREFYIQVRHNIDTELRLSGGVDSEIVTKEKLR